MSNSRSEISFSPDANVLVVGAASIDIVSRLRGEAIPGESNPSHIRSFFGGVGRNVAENLGRLGQSVTFLSAVGQDEQGDRLVAQLAEAGVGVGAIMRTPEYPTNTYIGIINQRADLQLGLDDMRAILALKPDVIRAQAELFEQASLVFVDTNLSPETLRTVISLARRARLPIFADPTSAILADRLTPYLKYIYLITPNHSEAGVLCGRQVEASKRRQAMDAAKFLVAQGVKISIVTLAKFGVCYATSETAGYIPAIRTEIVDPTGAGDALTAAVIFALINGIPLDDALRLGVSAATLTLRSSGAVTPELSQERLYDHLVI
jgi:pseudouridine kinase